VTEKAAKFSKIDVADIECMLEPDYRDAGRTPKQTLLRRMAELHNPHIELCIDGNRIVGAVFPIEESVNGKAYATGLWRVEVPKIGIPWVDKADAMPRMRVHEMVLYVHEANITTFGVCIPRELEAARPAPQMSPDEIEALLGNDPSASAKLVATCTRCGENFTAIEVGRISSRLADPAHQTLHHDGLCGGALGPYQADDAP